MAYIAMTGCIITTPTISLQFLLGLFPLSMHIQAEVTICMKRFKYLEHWKTFSDYLTGKKLNRDLGASFAEYAM